MGRGFPASSNTRASAAVRGGGRLSPGGGRAAREGEEVEGATPVFEPLARHELRMTYAHQYAHFSSPFRGGRSLHNDPWREGHRAGQEVGAGTAKPGGTTAVSMGAEDVRGSGPGVRSSWQSLGRCWRSAVHSVRKEMDRFGEFLVPTHAVAVASDVDDVPPVEQAVGQRGGQDREAKDQTPSGDVSVGPATCQIPAIP